VTASINGRVGRLAVRIAIPLLLVAAFVTPARADQTAPISPLVVPQPDPVQTWYGWQVLAADAGSIALFFACPGNGNDSCSLGAAGYWLGGPIIHTVHRGWGRGFVSLALRGALPTLGGIAGALTRGCTRTPDDILPFCVNGDRVLVGVEIGLVAAIAIDGAWAFDEAPAPRPLAGASSLAPTLTFNRDSAGFGLAGRF
jgi:hypothetical protein